VEQGCCADDLQIGAFRPGQAFGQCQDPEDVNKVVDGIGALVAAPGLFDGDHGYSVALT
jgi:hypothetical protein